jgi:CheY-like chemotaxis protein
MRILVVDDTETMRTLLSAFFESLGHEVVTLASGRDVLAELGRGRFDIVFTDVAMPDFSGWQVLRTVRAAAPGTPVVLVSGYDLGDDRRGERPDAVLEKPFTLERIRQVLDAVARPH